MAGLLLATPLGGGSAAAAGAQWLEHCPRTVPIKITPLNRMAGMCLSAAVHDRAASQARSPALPHRSTRFWVAILSIALASSVIAAFAWIGSGRTMSWVGAAAVAAIIIAGGSAILMMAGVVYLEAGVRSERSDERAEADWRLDMIDAVAVRDDQKAIRDAVAATRRYLRATTS